MNFIKSGIRFSLVLGTLIVFLLGMRMVLKADAIRDPQDEMMKKIGAIEFSPRVLSDDIAFQGNHISVSKDEYLRTLEIAKVLEINDPGNYVKTKLLRREAGYYIALEAGYTVTEEEIQNAIQENIDLSAGENVVDGGFQAYLEGAGLTSEQYWNSMRDSLEKRLMAMKYEKGEYERFSGKSLDDPDPSASKLWNEHLNEQADSYIKNDQVKDLI